jgi:hypothetical protein
VEASFLGQAAPVTYFPESNQYTVYPAGNQPNSIVDRYRSIDEVRGSTKITGSERLSDLDCTVVEIDRPDSIRTLWIDPKANLIVKDDSAMTSTAGTNWRWRRSRLRACEGVGQHRRNQRETVRRVTRRTVQVFREVWQWQIQASGARRRRRPDSKVGQRLRIARHPDLSSHRVIYLEQSTWTINKPGLIRKAEELLTWHE